MTNKGFFRCTPSSPSFSASSGLSPRSSLLFKVWDVLGPIVLGISKNHIVQAAALVITYIVIFGVPRLVLGEALRLIRSPYMTPSP